MSALTHVFCKVPEGREVPIPANEASSAGGGVLRCLPGKVYKLAWTTYTRRRILGGDLILTNQGGTKVDSPEAARAAATVKVDGDGAVDADQRPDDEINAAAAVERAKELAAESARAIADHRATKFDTSDETTKGRA